MNPGEILHDPGSAPSDTALPVYLPNLTTIGEAIACAASALVAAGIDDARLEAEVLTGHVLGWTRARVLAHPEHRLSAHQARRLGRLLAFRAARWPLSYLTGWREFFGLRLRVNRSVLIPRPETELLVEAALECARSRTAGGQQLSVVDVGTGSGAIAVTLARHLPGAAVLAIDASAGALRVAAYNARLHGVAGQVRLLCGDLLTPLDRPVDLVVANLPYIPTGDLAGLSPEVQHEPRLALNGGPDGLQPLRHLLDQLPGVLNAGGAAFLEIGAAQGAAARALVAARCPAAQVAVLKDYAGLDRTLSIKDWLCTSSSHSTSTGRS